MYITLQQSQDYISLCIGLMSPSLLFFAGKYFQHKYLSEISDNIFHP